MNLKLEELGPSHEQAFLAAMKDYQVADPDTFRRLYLGKKSWNPAEFEAFVKDCAKQRMDWRPKAHAVSVTHYALIGDDGSICGFGRLRFPLDSVTELDGGNLEVDVPPAKRQQGHGTLTLNRLLFEAVRAGLARVLVTCPSQDSWSRKIIEYNRGQFEDEVVSPVSQKSISRFWIRFR